MQLSFATPQPLDFLHSVTLAPRIYATGAAEEYPYYFTSTDMPALLPILNKAGHFFLETGTRQSLEESLDHLYAVAPDFGLSLTSQSAYHHTCCESIAIAIEQRFFLSKTQRINIMTCLHEAITNAVFHGNLELESPHDATKFADYYDTAATRIRQDHYKDRRVCITARYHDGCIEFSITDQGKGFPTVSLPEYTHSEQKVSGRGLYLINSLADDLWVGSDNRTLCMTFRQ